MRSPAIEIPEYSLGKVARCLVDAGLVLMNSWIAGNRPEPWPPEPPRDRTLRRLHAAIADQPVAGNAAGAPGRDLTRRQQSALVTIVLEPAMAATPSTSNRGRDPAYRARH